MIHSIDDHGNIIYTNKTAEQLLGYTKEEFLKMNIRQIYAPEILDALEKGFTDLKKKGDKTVESMLKTKDGRLIPVEIRSFSIYDDEGQFLRTFSILRDMREIKELQKSLIHTSRLAAIGELSSGVAHDINNPLTVILLANELIFKEFERKDVNTATLNKNVRGHALDVQKASKSIQKLADHLRNFSRGMAERYEPVDLFDPINDALFITNNKIMKSLVVVKNELKKGCCFVHGLPNQLEQVFVNLIGNACDAMAATPRHDLTIRISETELDNVACWTCNVADTGTGIPAELMEDIFHSFFTTKEKGKGTGLGLSISRGIIRDHKGDIRVESTPGKGSTFSVILPKFTPP
jgi:PAS domain S-box-containing protein